MDLHMDTEITQKMRRVGSRMYNAPSGSNVQRVINSHNAKFKEAAMCNKNHLEKSNQGARLPESITSRATP